jgi:N-acetylglucosamine-6-phosphate deacetylase
MYNAMPPLHHRNPGIIGAAFDNTDCRVELICDGLHIHPSVVRATFQMFSEDRIVLISDSMRATGMPNGEYTLGGQAVLVEDGKATLKSDGNLAGSVTNLMDCMKNLVLNMGIPLEQAVKCAAVNPVKTIGIYNKYGSLQVDKVANIVLLDQQLNIKSIIFKGRVIR